MKNIILASQSPRRRELLTQIGLEFEVHPAGGEEIITSTDPVEVVKSLSTQKAAAVKEELEPQLPENWLVIGADTIVVYDGKILGKPKDEADAIRMLRMLQGQTHSVYTGVTLLEEGKIDNLCGRDKSIHVPDDRRRDCMVCQHERADGQSRSLRDPGTLRAVCRKNPGRL